SIAALLISAPAAVTLTPAANGLTLSTGALLTTGANAAAIASSGTATMNFANEGIVFQNATLGTTINPVVSGIAALTVAGAQTLTIPAVSINTFSGGTVLNAGTLTFGASSNLGTGALTLNGGTFSSAITIANPVNLNGLVTVGSAVTFLGAATVSGSGAVIANANITFQGA